MGAARAAASGRKRGAAVMFSAIRDGDFYRVPRAGRINAGPPIADSGNKSYAARI